MTPPEPDRSRALHVVGACYLGWTLDAFDFFIMVFTLNSVLTEFGIGPTVATWAITLTLAMRALGAWIFGRLADRHGRRPVLMASVLCYAAFEFLSGLAPSFAVFLVLRALYGVAMGGEWGAGASLTMESIPARWRGWVSGLLQSGYPSGYFLASLLFLAEPAIGWRGMFMVGAAPALLVLYIRRAVPESPEWAAERGARARIGIGQVLRRHAGLAVFAVALMTCFNFFSHGTQDLYPSYFLGRQHHLPHATVTAIALIYNAGAVLGGVGCAALSQVIGRRRMIAIAALAALPVIPLWAFTSDVPRLALGAFLMQLCVQGAWGVIPAHLNELSPPAIRATFPGFVYQLGNLLAATNATIQSAIAEANGGDYAIPLAGTVAIVGVLIAVLVLLGPEGRDVRMGAEREAALA